MVTKITAEQMGTYRATARRRRQERAYELESRRQRAWTVAEKAGRLLKEQFGAKKVVVFGSVNVPERFHRYSDVDLAVWGLDERDYYRAVSRLLDLDFDISVDLVEAELASSTLLAIIELEGKPV
jgi:predicted nucleotidyltransferase